MQSLKVYLFLILAIFSTVGCEEIEEILQDCDGLGLACVKPCLETEGEVCSQLLGQLEESINIDYLSLNDAGMIQYNKELPYDKVQDDWFCNTYLQSGFVRAVFNGDVLNVSYPLEFSKEAINTYKSFLMLNIKTSADVDMRADMNSVCLPGNDSFWLDASAHIDAGLTIILQMNALITMVDNMPTQEKLYLLTINPKIRIVPNFEYSQLNVEAHSVKVTTYAFQGFNSALHSFGDFFTADFDTSWDSMLEFLGFSLMSADKLISIDNDGLIGLEDKVYTTLTETRLDEKINELYDTIADIELRYNTEVIPTIFTTKTFTYVHKYQFDEIDEIDEI